MLSTLTYGNGASVGYTYDGLDRVTQKLYNNVVKFEYTYDKLGNLVRHNNLVNNTTTKYAYDLIGRILNVKSSNGTSLFYKYDQYNRTNFIKYIVGSKAVSLNYLFGTSTGENPDFLYGIQQNGTDIISYSYDKLARLNSRTLNTTTGFTSNYTYLAGANAGSTTTLIESINNGGNTLSYTYDDVGNITQIKKNNNVYESYEYDGLNQLTKVTRGTGEDADSYTYTYDNGGNILEVKLKNTTVKSYDYDYAKDDPRESIGWKDLLTKYNDTDIEYDDIGNPLVYRDGFTFEWSNGRQLTGVTHGTDNISYLYDDNGLRTQKTVNGVTTDYYRLNGVLLGQKTGSEYIIYLYDENGTAYGLLLKNGTTEEYYYYIYNAQGDVIGIIDESGTQVVEYDYDAWGKVLSITGTGAQTIGEKNPIRYRGYYYDTETGLYYLQSRYYDPETGRFINADGYVSTGQGVLGYNMFAYCGNNPIVCADPNGQFWGIVVGVTLAVGLVVALSGCSKPKTKPEPYKSADEAAKAFSEQVYSASLYIRHEYSTEIYSRTINGKTTYNYNPPRAGNPHSASVGNPTPKGTKTVAYAHTHPNSNVFSGTDIRAAENLKIDAYVVGPDLKLQRYSLSSASTTNLGVISPIALTDAQRSSLVAEFQVSWDAHIAGGCDFNCGSMPWPTP